MVVNISLNLTQSIARPNLACSVANNNHSFFFFDYDIPENHFKLINQSPFKREDIIKGKRQLETTGHMKNCRVWDVSLSHYPSQCMRAFGDKTSVTEKDFSLYKRLYFVNRNLFQNKRAPVSP